MVDFELQAVQSDHGTHHCKDCIVVGRRDLVQLRDMCTVCDLALIEMFAHHRVVHINVDELLEGIVDDIVQSGTEDGETPCSIPDDRRPSRKRTTIEKSIGHDEHRK